jgi:hypothetical protein
MQIRRGEVVALLVSWSLWGLLVFHVYRPSDGFLGNGDSISHFGHAILFAHHGFDVYRHPGKEFCRDFNVPAAHAFAKTNDLLDGDLCQTRGGEPARPFFLNWQDLPQPYPPGAILFAAPDAWLFTKVKASFRDISVFTRLKYLAAAHWLVWLIYRALLEVAPRARGARRWLLAGGVALLYFEIIKWSLSGFYDPIAVGAVVLSVYYLSCRRGVDALLALSLGFFLHYRALWYAPIFAIALFQIGEARSWRRRPTIFAVKVALAAVLGGVSAYSFLLLYPALKDFPATNAVFFKRLTLSGQVTWDVLVPLFFIAAFVAHKRHWALFVTMAWQSFMLVQTPQIMQWHVLFVIPVLVMGGLTRDPGAMVAATGFFWLEAQSVFSTSLLPGQLLSAVFAL